MFTSIEEYVILAFDAFPPVYDKLPLERKTCASLCICIYIRKCVCVCVCVYLPVETRFARISGFGEGQGARDRVKEVLSKWLSSP